jgi:hypothetical protein
MFLFYFILFFLPLMSKLQKNNILLGIEALDMLDFLFGPLTHVSGDAVSFPVSLPDAPLSAVSLSSHIFLYFIINAIDLISNLIASALRSRTFITVLYSDPISASEGSVRLQLSFRLLRSDHLHCSDRLQCSVRLQLTTVRLLRSVCLHLSFYVVILLFYVLLKF